MVKNVSINHCSFLASWNLLKFSNLVKFTSCYQENLVTHSAASSDKILNFLNHQQIDNLRMYVKYLLIFYFGILFEYWAKY